MQQSEKPIYLLPQSVPLAVPITKDVRKDNFLGTEDTNFDNAEPELSERCIGPMPARKFISALLPADSQVCDKKMPSGHIKLKDVFLRDSYSRRENFTAKLVRS